MLDTKISDRIRQIVHAQDQAFTEQLNNNCTAIQNRLSAHGGALGGRAISEMYDMSRATLNDKANFVWETFKRVLAALQVQWSADLADDMKGEMAIHLNQYAGEANRVFRNRIPNGFPADQLPINEHFLVARLNAEIDLLVASLKVQVERASLVSAAAPSVQHNYNLGQGNIVFVSGQNASAEVTYNAEGQAALKEALEGIAQAIAQSNLGSDHKREALELTADTIDIASSKTPNMTKLRTQLRGLAEIVGGLANASTLASALYNAAQFVGIVL